jgi:hypothetical protein
LKRRAGVTSDTISKIDAAVEALKAVYKRHCAGCCLHILADDGNIEQSHASWCAGYAAATGHKDCIAAADLLENMTDPERGSVYARYDDYAGSVQERFPVLKR